MKAVEIRKEAGKDDEGTVMKATTKRTVRGPSLNLPSEESDPGPSAPWPVSNAHPAFRDKRMPPPPWGL